MVLGRRDWLIVGGAGRCRRCHGNFGVAVASKDTQEQASSSAILEATDHQPTHQLTYPVSKVITHNHLGSRGIWGLPGGCSVTPKAQRTPRSDWDKTQQGVCGWRGYRGAGRGIYKMPLKIICSFDVLSNEEFSCFLGGKNKYSKNIFNTYISFLCIILQPYFLCTIL